MSSTNQQNSTLAKPVAPEDLRRGDYVAVLTEVVELPSFLWGCESHTLPPDEPVTIRYRPLESGRPLKVRQVCLPFVLVRLPCGHTRTLDIRSCTLARLSPSYGQQVRKAWRKERKQKKQRRSCCEGVCYW